MVKLLKKNVVAHINNISETIEWAATKDSYVHLWMSFEYLAAGSGDEDCDILLATYSINTCGADNKLVRTKYALLDDALEAFNKLASTAM